MNGRLKPRINSYGFSYAMTTQEVADKLGMSISMVDHIERRALVKIREKLLGFNIDLYLTDGLNTLDFEYRIGE
jgi:transcriptional regulator with XRE-family HTH domain